MKFAKDLEADLVPEWRAKYLNYKDGKKKIKAVSRALRALHRSPVPASRPALQQSQRTESLPYTHYDFHKRSKSVSNTPADVEAGSGEEGGNYKQKLQMLRRKSMTTFAESPPIAGLAATTEPTESSPEGSPVQDARREIMGKKKPKRYGSIIGTPPQAGLSENTLTQIPSLYLPASAMDHARSGRAESALVSRDTRGFSSKFNRVSSPFRGSRRQGDSQETSIGSSSKNLRHLDTTSKSTRLPHSQSTSNLLSETTQGTSSSSKSSTLSRSQAASAADAIASRAANSATRTSKVAESNPDSIAYSGSTAVTDPSPIVSPLASPRSAAPVPAQRSTAAAALSSHSSKRARDDPRLRRRSNTAHTRFLNLFTNHNQESGSAENLQQDALKVLDARQDDFYSFLDGELAKIEDFYKMKEKEANGRLTDLRRQLHEMRDRRQMDIEKALADKQRNDHGNSFNGMVQVGPVLDMTRKDHRHPGAPASIIWKPVEHAFSRKPNIGKTSKAMSKLSTPNAPKAESSNFEGSQDYSRRKSSADSVPYKSAKRRLKLALQEFYRGLELLKSYALLNRTAFRKINKKYDKAINARPPMRYVSEKVDKAYFVRSSVIDDHLVAVEDLYARYFERGSHKLAIGKLRTRQKSSDQSSPSFRNGLFLAAGCCFGALGLVKANDALSDPRFSAATPYILQLYGGYFLALLLYLFFVLDCSIWNAAKINYVFVFEFDTRHVLDWRQLAELPCFFFFLEGLIVYLNFSVSHADDFVMYWPAILIAVTLIVLAIPLRIFHYHAREWWAYSHWRLFLAGLYPVEFRDFFMGDMYCSETYALGQVELFFCLYAKHLNYDPGQNRCSANYSRLLGFFTALPAIWRALQCLRRYYDTRKWFPHLANCAKYGCNILYYMALSLYRIDHTAHPGHHTLRWIFIIFACVNGLYCSFWDVFMDFSLGHPWSVNPFLRDHLAYRRKWVYYVAALMDVLLRHSWIIYAVFLPSYAYTPILGFGVSLLEVIRRGIWSIFRVENEHCNNVGKFRASRDIPLPYNLPESSQSNKNLSPEQRRRLGAVDEDLVNRADIENALPPRTSRPSPMLKRISGQPGMRALQRVGSAITTAHLHDFEKRKRPGVGDASIDNHTLDAHYSSDDDEDDDEEQPLNRQFTTDDPHNSDNNDHRQR